jgi:hypothetical protein
MKASSFMLATFVSLLLFAANFGSESNLRERAKSTDTQSKGLTEQPSFLEKGKTYSFTFGASLGGPYGTNPLTITGRIEKFDVNSSWVYNLSPISCEYAKAVKFGPLYFSPDFIGQNEHGQI